MELKENNARDSPNCVNRQAATATFSQRFLRHLYTVCYVVKNIIATPEKDPAVSTFAKPPLTALHSLPPKAKGINIAPLQWLVGGWDLFIHLAMLNSSDSILNSILDHGPMGLT